MAHHLFLYATRKQDFFYLTFLHYICDSMKYFIWLSTNYIQLAWEWATDKKMPNCSETLYSSCFQITLCFDAKIAFFLRIPEFSGYKFMMNQWNNLYRTWQSYRSRVPLTHRQRYPVSCSYKQGQALRVSWKNHPRPEGLRYFSRQPCMYGTRPFIACSYGNSGPEKPD